MTDSEKDQIEKKENPQITNQMIWKDSMANLTSLLMLNLLRISNNNQRILIAQTELRKAFDSIH